MTLRSTLFLLGIILSAATVHAQPGIQWQTNLGGSSGDSATSIKHTADGGYIVVGQSSSNNTNVTGNHGGVDYWVAKLNSTGAIVWQKSYGGSGTDIAKCVQQTTDGGYVIVGNSNSIDGDVTDHGRTYTYSPGDTEPNYSEYNVFEPWVVKITSTGTITWTRSIHRIYFSDQLTQYYDNYAGTIMQAADGGYLIGGTAPALPDDPLYAWHINEPTLFAEFTKITSSGSFSFSKDVYEGYRMELNAIQEVVSGSTVNYVLGMSGAYEGLYNGSTDIFIYSYNTSFTFQWGVSFLGGNDDKISCLQKTADGGFVISGTSASTDGDFTGLGNHGGNDYFVAKLSYNGRIQWSRCFGGSGSDEASSIQALSDGTFVVAGSSYSYDGLVTDHSTVSGVGLVQADYWLAGIAANGSFNWGKCFGGSAADKAYSLDKTIDGGLIVAGASGSVDAGFTSKGATDYWVLKLQECGANPRPAAPATQSFCSTSNATVANLAATGTNLRWYTVSTGGTALASTTALVSGHYYVSQTPGLCESSRTPVSVTLTITTPPAVTAAQSFCSSTHPVVANLAATGTAIKWYSASTGGAALAASTGLINGTAYYASQTVSGCESGRRPAAVTLSACRMAGYQQPEIQLGNETANATVYPNPARNNVTVNIRTLNTNAVIRIELLNVYGNVLQQQSAINDHGLVKSVINVQQLPAALYFIKYFIGKETGVLRFQVGK